MSRNMGNNTITDITRNGIVAGTVRAFVISPIEVVKIQQQVKPSRTLTQVASEVWQKAGLRGFGRGFTTTLTREPVAFACYFSSFEILSQGRKDDNLMLFLGDHFYLSPRVCPTLQGSRRTGRDLLLGDDLPAGCHQVSAPGGRLGWRAAIPRGQTLPQTDCGRGRASCSLQRIWLHHIQSFHRQWSHPDGL